MQNPLPAGRPDAAARGGAGRAGDPGVGEPAALPGRDLERNPLPAGRPDAAARDGAGVAGDPGVGEPAALLHPVNERGWAPLDTLNLADEFRVRVRCLQAVPGFLRGPLRTAYATSLGKLRGAFELGDEQYQTRCWVLFRLTSRMLLWRSQARGPTRKELEERVRRFQNEEWLALAREARAAGSTARRSQRQLTEAEELERRARRAETCVRRGEVSRGR